MTVQLNADQVAATREKFDKINARAEKRGLAGRLVLTAEPVHVVKTNDLGFTTEYDAFECAITGEAPKYGEWSFIARLDWDASAGLIVSAAPGAVRVNRETLRENWCDHCQTTRERKNTYVVVSDVTGRQLQVGSTCLKDFLGWSASIAWLDAPEESELGDWCGGGGAYEFSAETVLAVAWAVVKAYGFVPSRMPGSTSQAVRTALYPGRDKWTREFAAMIRPLAAEATQRARELQEFLLSDAFGGDSDYVLNLKSLARAAAVNPRYIGILASAPQAWARSLERDLTRRAKAAQPSEWIGTEGGKITFTGVIESLRWISNDFGSTALYTLRNAETGNIVKWFASRPALGEETGITVTITGTVKKLDEYNGVKATVVTRCKLVDDAPAPRKATADKHVHAADNWSNASGHGTLCGQAVKASRTTWGPSEVTCPNCLGADTFASWRG
jgi:hypothetical protein